MKYLGIYGSPSIVCSQHWYWLQEQSDCATNLVQTTGNLYHWHFHVSEGEAVYPVGWWY